MRRLRLAAFGTSLYLRGIADRLAGEEGFTVAVIDPDARDAARQLDELEPDAVILEVHTPDLATPMDVLRQRPRMRLLVIDPECEEVLLLSSQRSKPTTVAQLVDFLMGMRP